MVDACFVVEGETIWTFSEEFVGWVLSYDAFEGEIVGYEFDTV